MRPTPAHPAIPPNTIHQAGAIIATFSISLVAVLDFALGGHAWGVAVAFAAVIGWSHLHGGRHASSTCTATGSVLVGAGTAHLLLMSGELNPFELRPIEVISGIVLGLSLSILGTYGRGGDVFRQVNTGVTNRGRPEEHHPTGVHQELLRAEIAMAEGHPTPEQELILMAHGSKAHRARRHTPARIPHR